MRRTKRGGWPYSQPPNTQFEINWDSQQADGLVLWMPWGGGTPGAHSRHVDRISGLVFTEGGTPTWVADGERGWSMLFDDAQNEYLWHTSAVVTAYPFTLACWFYSDDIAHYQILLAVGVEASTGCDQLIAHGAEVGDPIEAYTVDNVWNAVSADTTTGYSANTWHHACGVFAANNDRRAFIDGGSKGTNANARNIVTPDRTRVGRWGGGANPIGFMSGRIADVRVYNHALTDTEVWQLYVEPWELYKPLIRRFLGWSPPGPPPVGGHMTLWGRYWGP